MKRIVLVLMAGVLMTSGCSVSESSQGLSESTARILPPSEPEMAYDDSLIGEAWSSEGTVQIGDYPASYHYRVPKLLSEKPGAGEFNEHLLSIYSREAYEGYVSDYICSLDYETRWYGSLLSLIISQETWDGSPTHSSYFFDFSRDQEMTAEEVLDDYAGIAAEKFFLELEREAAYAQDEITWFEPDYSVQGIAEMKLRRAETIALVHQMRNLQVPLFLNEDGTPGAYIPVYSTGAGMWVETECSMDPGWVCLAEEAEADFLHAEADADGQISIWFSKNLKGRAMHSAYRFAYDTKYPVSGCYGRYTDLLFGGTSEETEIPDLFLLTEEHTVEYIDVGQCMKSGVYVCGGPLYGIGGIQKLETDETGIVYGVKRNGERISLSDEIHPSGIPVSLFGNWEISWGTRSYSLLINEDGSCVEDYEHAGEGYLHEGMLACVGISPDGLICVSEGNEEPSLSPVYGFVRNEESVLCLTYLHGLDIYELEHKEQIYLEKTGEGVMNASSSDSVHAWTGERL